MEKPSFTFWPVGNGDSTTIHVGDGTVVQIDIHDLAAGDDEDDPHIAVIDALVELLPVVDGKPYLAAFALTHADEDHCKGFVDLLNEVVIGDLWFSPYVLRDEPDLSPTPRRSARRRAAASTRTSPRAPSAPAIASASSAITTCFGGQVAGCPRSASSHPAARSARSTATSTAKFRVFVHGPVGSEDEIERNDTSLAMQVILAPAGVPARLLLLGDLAYPGVKRVFDESEDADVSFDILLAPHHCSKSVSTSKRLTRTGRR